MHSADGLNKVTDDFTLHSGNNFDVIQDPAIVVVPTATNAIATGIAVGGNVRLNRATVRVTDIDPINTNNGHADFTFGRRHTLVRAVGAGNVLSGFAHNAQLYDVNNNTVFSPALDLTTRWDANSAWMDWLTDFERVANTRNQQRFGRYLDNLVTDSNNAPGDDGIDPNSSLGTTLNYLVSRNPNAKSYAAMLEIGKRIDKKTYNFTPYVSLLGIKYDREAIRETGTGASLKDES